MCQKNVLEIRAAREYGDDSRAVAAAHVTALAADVEQLPPLPGGRGALALATGDVAECDVGGQLWSAAALFCRWQATVPEQIEGAPRAGRRGEGGGARAAPSPTGHHCARRDETAASPPASPPLLGAPPASPPLLGAPARRTHAPPPALVRTPPHTTPPCGCLLSSVLLSRRLLRWPR